MPIPNLRSAGDVALESKLLEDMHIRAARDALDKKNDLGARKHLLATSVRITAAMAPKLVNALNHCRTVLGVKTEVELYVYPDPRFNAGCVRPEQGRVFVMLSSSLLESFDAGELLFVMGHELGHHLFEHHRMPLGMLLSGNSPLPTSIALNLFAWSRYAEISADRAGLACTESLQPVTSSLFKLASGLKSPPFRVELSDMLSQMGDMEQEKAAAAVAAETPQGDWFATHPFSPLRLQAAKLFAESTVFKDQAADSSALEAAVADLMSYMEPTYLSDKGDVAETMRRVLLAAGMTVATADGAIAGAEKAALERYFGAGSLDNVNAEALQKDLPARIAALVEKVPPLRRHQVIRDLCVVARADGTVAAPERGVLLEVAAKCGVSGDVVERALSAVLELD
jgi:tellurite resistance protein